MNRYAVLGLTAVVLVLALAISPSLKAKGQTQPGDFPPIPAEQSLTRARPFDSDLRQLRHILPVKRERPERQAPVQDLAGELVPIGGGLAAPSLAAPAPAPIASFEGLDFDNWGAGHAPDPNGDVGPGYYIQTVNTARLRREP
jgi:hypothetical protein